MASRARTPAIVTAPPNDPRPPTPPQSLAAALSDTILARRPPRSAPVGEDGSAAPSASLADRLRELPAGIQGIWVGLVCITLLVGSAGALRSLFDGSVGALPGPPAGSSTTGALSITGGPSPTSSTAKAPASTST